MAVIRNYPFDPLRGLAIPTGGLGDPQSSYLKTPLIRPIPTSRNVESEVAKSKPTVSEKKDESK
jgi:hypothetical protein